MISGKPLTALVEVGLKPQIIVTAPVGSTVTCTTPGGVVLTATEVSGTWTFVNLPGLGTYTIDASLGIESKMESVVVDKVTIYNINIKYELYLYHLGNECTSITGGWRNSYYPWTADWLTLYGLDTLTRKQTSMVLTSNGSTSSGATAPQNKIDVTNFSTLTVHVTENVVAGNYNNFYITLSNTLTRADNVPGVDVKFIEYSHGETGDLTLDISDISGEYYITLQHYKQVTSSVSKVEFDKIWLE